MNLKFKPVTAEDIAKIIPFFGLRPDKTCESVFLDSFLWRDYYHIQYTIYEEKGLLWKMEQEGKTYTSIPSCRQEDLPELLGIMKDYFNQTLGYLRYDLRDLTQYDLWLAEYDTKPDFYYPAVSDGCQDGSG